MSSDLSTDYVEHTIKLAQKIFREHGDSLKTFAGDYLSKAVYAVCKSGEISHEFGVDNVCMKCDIEDGGSCCGKGMENYYDEAMLLANLAAGVELPQHRFDPSGCYFLGPRGCILKLRHTICVNYLCKKLYEYLGRERVIKLQKVCGDEIHATFLLHERILKFLRGL